MAHWWASFEWFRIIYFSSIIDASGPDPGYDDFPLKQYYTILSWIADQRMRPHMGFVSDYSSERTEQRSISEVTAVSRKWINYLSS